jgi:N-acetylmuramoyl-L-alanine amidase
MKTKLIILPTAKQISEISNFFERKKYMSNKPIIVIDPGHGGKEKVGGSSPNNATGANGLLEKNLTLDIANRVVKSLANQADVFMTRTNDTNLGLAARAKVAKDKNASLFLSIHFNGFSDTKVDGTEVWVAKDANSAGKNFAKTLLENVVDTTKVKNRGVREGNLGVLLPNRHSTSTSACLLEVSFLSNPMQARELESDKYKQSIANSIISAVRQHFSLSPTAQSLFYDNQVSLSLGKEKTPSKTLDEIAKEMGYGSKNDYVGKEVKSATLFGLSVDGGIHPDFYKKLQAAETKAKAMITPTPTTASDWGVKSVSGYQKEKPGGYHPWGLAIDIDYAENPYIMHEAGEDALDKMLEPVYQRISRFVLGRNSVIPKDMSAGKKSVGDMYDMLKAESDAMKKYFQVMQDTILLQKELDSYPASNTDFWEKTWGLKTSDHSVDTVLQIMMKDYVILAGKAGPSISGKTYPSAKTLLKGVTGPKVDVPFDDKGKFITRKPENGFLTIRKELVLALTGEGLRWGAMHFGGASGDIMHFDDGKSGTLALKIATIKKAPAKAKSQSFDYSDENHYSQPFSGTFGEKDVAWAADYLSPDYNHLGGSISTTPFEFTAAKLALLCEANYFNVKTNEKDPRDEVLFGLRGCILADSKESSGGFVDKVMLVEAVPNHKECKCVVGVWKRSTNKIAVFIGSTVPNWSGMKKQLDDPKKLTHCNMRPTGKYKHKVGIHNKGTNLEIKGAIKEDEKVPAIRTIDNLIYEITDLWTFGTPGDNIHPTRTTKTTDKFSSEGCITVLGTYDKSSEKHAGLWSEFRKAAGLTAAAAPTSEDNWEFIFVLLTGREARLISPATKNALTCLRFGSSGVDVQALQLMLSLTQRKDKTKGTYYTGTKDGSMGAGTVQAYTDWQFDGEGFRDGIVTPLDGKSLGIDIVKHLSLKNKVWHPRMMLYEDWFLKPNLTPKSSGQQSATDYYTAKAGVSYNVQKDILVTAKVEAKMEELAKKVYDDTDPHHKITYSSGYRGPDRQAKAMYDKIVKDADAFDIYKAKDLAKDIKQAYLDNKSKGEADTVAKMKEVIEKQVKDGKYISNHLVSGAADISSVDSAFYDKIRKFAKEMGMKAPLDEGDHLHVEF